MVVNYDIVIDIFSMECITLMMMMFIKIVLSLVFSLCPRFHVGLISFSFQKLMMTKSSPGPFPHPYIYAIDNFKRQNSNGTRSSFCVDDGEKPTTKQMMFSE